MTIKTMWKQHQTAILCVIAILALAFPLITVSTDYSDETITGFGAISDSFFTLLLIILPFGLGVSNYVSQIRKYKPLLDIAVPAFCELVLILVFFTCKSAATAGADAMSAFGDAWGIDAGIKVKVGAGAIIAFVAYAVMIFFGVVNRKDNTESGRDGKICNIITEKINKMDSNAIVDNMHEKASLVVEKVRTVANEVTSNGISGEGGPSAKKSISINRTNEILALIEKLSAMKDAGVLTEDEFSEKKKALLEEI